ncbi:hypothetical protein [Tuwongella immobilis]|uniref:Actin-like protein N-terminal domain-containing protein n=1 Tax=Tuwongella immobilis TaxID=692036 RepID=A0A6C2YLR5_9BACT|nr:hypothetical protein [Tuwongella immobilis]VIP02520.1 unnamed protein product [Tuwongella immobilis]VTS01649.1 unnamed protein product [Tuwongella immobilis]
MSAARFSIDFGNAYTKVACRLSAESMSFPVANIDTSARDSIDRFFHPTTALVNRLAVDGGYRFGEEANRTAESATYQIRNNWKPHLFRTPQGTPTELPRGLRAMIQSAELQQLSRQYRLNPAEHSAWQHLLSGMLALLPESAAATQPESGPDDVIELAVAFFRDLRQRTLRNLQAIRVPANLDPSQFPTRICVPAFFDVDQSTLSPSITRLISEILTRAGWPLDPDEPILPEPLANVIGVITEGRNIIWKPYAHTNSVHLGRMFEHESLVRSYKKNRSDYCFLVCDAGSYTTDFAFVRFLTMESVDRRPEIRVQSTPLGVSQLDQECILPLSPEKAAWFQSIENTRREAVRSRIFVAGEAYASSEITEVGDVGDDADRPLVELGLARFSQKLTESLDQFCDSQQISRIDEVILTGGGNFIPTVRNAILSGLAKRFGSMYVVRVPPGTSTRSQRTVLTAEQVRLGTAIGGCSVYFDAAYR